ncbi:right-handed parallel beta-helix repeat-containing protein [candidate division KSB1 bacterium]|nr:right-handed parallel beta-helix repeat-containing protein [candidate division KSB1 bacterium]
MKKTRYLLFGLALLFGTSCSQDYRIFVSPLGDDSGDGSKKNPFLTLKKARDTIRALREQGLEKPVTVYVRGGTYPACPLVLSREDSGSQNAPVIYKAFKDEIPVFTGGQELKNWQLLEDEAKLAKLDPAVNGKIYVTNLQATGISDFGDPIAYGNRPELFCNGQRQTLARWPDSGFVFSGPARGKTELPSVHGRGRRTQEGALEYLEKHQNRWANEKDGCLAGYWYWDWSEGYQKIDKVDPATKTLYLKEPYHNYGYGDRARYYGLNLFCELDQPTEWYLDRDTGLLYWYPPAGVDPEQAQVILTNVNAPHLIEIKDCAWLTLQGLTFQESRGSGILIRGGENCRVTDCRLERFGVEGIHLEGGFGHGIEGCLLNSFGYGGIVLTGGDRKTLTSSGFFVENTVVENFSLFKRTYEPAIYASGCGHRISHNRFRFSSSSAMRLDGNDFLIEYNEISQVVTESDDQGGVDMWYNPSYQGTIIRYNRWSDICGRGGANGAAGVRLDDMISGVQVYGNLFERCGSVIFGAVQIHGGKENVVANNIFYQCPAAVSFSAWDEKRWLDHLDSPVIRQKLYEEVDILSPQYQEKYPVLRDLRSNPNVNTLENNLIIDCEKEVLRDKNRINIYRNNSSLASRGKGIEYFCKPGVLKENGLQPIPLAAIGPKNNKWIE